KQKILAIVPYLYLKKTLTHLTDVFLQERFTNVKTENIYLFIYFGPFRQMIIKPIFSHHNHLPQSSDFYEIFL
ncbi:hypothetical protein, partial [Salmonella sp. gx-f5]|uniref:hypothetical protein n=1 Tax=Salmonella sp. gx-f5 TaxID=2582605 RepID=UPI001F48AFCA